MVFIVRKGGTALGFLEFCSICQFLLERHLADGWYLSLRGSAETLQSKESALERTTHVVAATGGCTCRGPGDNEGEI